MSAVKKREYYETSRQREPVFIEMDAFPFFIPNNPDKLVAEIAHYIQRVLKRHEQDNQSYWEMPSLIVLSDILICHTGEVLDALDQLEYQGYDVRFDGDFEPIYVTRSKRPVRRKPSAWHLTLQDNPKPKRDAQEDKKFASISPAQMFI